MMKTTASLLAAALLAAGPVFAEPELLPAPADAADQPAAQATPTELGEEAETDIEIINGVPVNPELKARIMASEEARTVQELLELSDEILNQQQEQLADQEKKNDTTWMGQDPLGHLEGEMSELVGHIYESDTGDSTQTQGKDLVNKMDALIAMMEKACSACSSCAGGGQGQGNMANGNNPADQSTLSQGPGGFGDLNATGEGNNQFGELDPQQRDAILRAQKDQEGFGSDFDALLAEYYARLAAEQALDTPNTDEGADPAE